MTLPSSLNWDYLRVFLAVVRSGSLRKAAAGLGTSHPTIRRRIKLLEEQLGIRLFDRGSDPLQPTPEALILIEKAEAVEASVQAFERIADGADPNLKGTIRITAPDLLMSDLLAPALAAFSLQYPEIVLEVDTSYELADLGNREADIAFRIIAKDSVPSLELTGRKVATTYTAVYGTGDQWLGWPDREQQKQWVAQTPFADLPIVGYLNNIYLQRAACREGMGLTLLPCFMADESLQRRTEPEASADLWVLIHPDLQENPRLRLFRTEMAKAFENLKPKMEGREV